MGVHVGQKLERGSQLASVSSPVVAVDAPAGRGSKRGQTARADKTDIGLRGFPVIGHGSGAISGTSPGGELGAGRRLEQAGRDLVATRMRAARAKLKEGART